MKLEPGFVNLERPTVEQRLVAATALRGERRTFRRNAVYCAAMGTNNTLGR